MSQLDIQKISDFKKPDGVSFNSRPDVKQANDDFRYLATQSYYQVLFNNGLLGVFKEQKLLADVLCVPIDLDKKVTTFPTGSVQRDNPKMCVVAICYRGGKPADALAFNFACLAQGKHKMRFYEAILRFFRKPALMLTQNEEKQEYTLTINDINHSSVRRLKFSIVFGQLQGKK